MVRSGRQLRDHGWAVNPGRPITLKVVFFPLKMSDCQQTAPTLEDLIARCRAGGLRRTHALESVLRLLAESERPLRAGDIVESAALKGQCDPATIYRMLLRLEEQGILRRLGLRDRAAHYTIRHAHTHDDYIVCTRCGSIEELQMDCPVEALEAEIAKKSGFTNLDHELEFFGVCPSCSETSGAAAT
jgi:Fur family ferric uptake transcriptional regulator